MKSDVWCSIGWREGVGVYFVCIGDFLKGFKEDKIWLDLCFREKIYVYFVECGGIIGVKVFRVV